MLVCYYCGIMITSIVNQLSMMVVSDSIARACESGCRIESFSWTSNSPRIFAVVVQLSTENISRSSHTANEQDVAYW